MEYYGLAAVLFCQHHCRAVRSKSVHPTPNEILIETAEALSEVTGFEIAGYDTFQGGRKVLAFLQNPQPNKVLDFPLDDYLLIGNSHDYSAAFFMGNTARRPGSVMLRCTNQFTQTNQQFKVAHTTHSQQRINEVVKGFEQYLHQNELLYGDFVRFSEINYTSHVKKSKESDRRSESFRECRRLNGRPQHPCLSIL